VLEQAQRRLDLPEAALAPARAVLRQYGNMSSATVLFVLHELLRTATPRAGEWGVMMALGPGFAAEGALLRW
jgi:alkylresorcinol/alkylpyrone synthase